MLVFAAVCLCAVLYLHSLDRQLFEGAATLNVATGEGFSDRFSRWDMAIRAIRTKPLTGHGFGQELSNLTQVGSEGVAHDDYLTVWLELGLGGLLLFVMTIFQFIRAGWTLHREVPFQPHGALILAVMFALCTDSLGLPTLYWEKLPTIVLSVAAAVIGLCERNGVDEVCALPESSGRNVLREPVALQR
jgi:O-antigen ligase